MFKPLYYCSICGNIHAIADKDLNNSFCGVCLIGYYDDLICNNCEYYAFEKDRNEEIVITFCSHPENKNSSEGNNTKQYCPIYLKEKR